MWSTCDPRAGLQRLTTKVPRPLRRSAKKLNVKRVRTNSGDLPLKAVVVAVEAACRWVAAMHEISADMDKYLPLTTQIALAPMTCGDWVPATREILATRQDLAALLA